MKRKSWKFRITNKRAFIKAVLHQNDSGLDVLVVDEAWLKKRVEVLHENAVIKRGKKYLYNGTVEIW